MIHQSTLAKVRDPWEPFDKKSKKDKSHKHDPAVPEPATFFYLLAFVLVVVVVA